MCDNNDSNNNNGNKSYWDPSQPCTSKEADSRFDEYCIREYAVLMSNHYENQQKQENSMLCNAYKQWENNKESK